MTLRIILHGVLMHLLVLVSPVRAEQVVEVVTKDYKFVPAELTVKVGTKVVWVNDEKRQYHSVYFPDLDKKTRDYFFPEERRERVFDKPGTYSYICEPHEKSHEMKGVIHVVE